MLRTLLPLVFYQVPEAFLLIIAALGLLGLRIRPGRLIVAGLGLGVITFISRRYLLGLFGIGLHTWAILASLTIILSILFNLSVRSALTGCFLSFFLLLMGETLIASPVLVWTKISYAKTLEHPWLHIGFGWLSSGFLIIASAVCHLGGVALIKAPETQTETSKG